MSYIGQEAGLGVAERYLYSPSGSGTVVSVDDTGLSIAYTVNQVSVYLNGVKQVIGTGKDVTATNGTSITFLSAYASGDVIEIIALSSFSPANTVPKTGGSFTGNVIHEADLRAGTIKSENGTGAMTITDVTGVVAHTEMSTFSKLLQNPDTISANITIASGFSAVAGGPINFTGTVAVNGNLSIV